MRLATTRRGACARRMRPLPARLIALVLAIAVVVPVASFGRVAWACSMLGRVVDSCCCPAPSLAPVASHQTRIKARDCCQMRVGQPDAAITASVEVALPVHAALPSARVAIVDVRALPARPVALPLVRSRAPPGAGVPLFIRHCALLG